MGLGNWVKQVTRNEGAAADPQTARPLVPATASAVDKNVAKSDTVSYDAAASDLPGRTIDGSERPASSDRWVGFIDRVTLTAIEGWACDTHNPGTHVTVEAVISNGKKVVAVAHSYRKDVEEAGYGDGACGFFLDLSKLTLKDESAIVRFAESKHPISDEPIDFDAARAVLTTNMPKSFFAVMELCAAETRQAAEAVGAPR